MNNLLPWDSLQAVLFDLDGTLIVATNRWPGLLADRLRPLRRVFPRLDTDALARWIFATIEMPANYVLSALEHLGVGTGFFGLTDRLRRSKGLATRGEAEWIAGSKALLKALAPRYKLAIVTTRGRPEALSFLQRTGCQHLFAAVITRRDVWRMKPHPEPVRKAARMLGVSVQRCAMVGDTVMDIVAARRAGAHAVAVLSGYGQRRELERAGAHLVLERAAQLLDDLPASVSLGSGPGR